MMDNYDKIKQEEALIEEKRLEIREIKKSISKLRNKIDVVGNIYEYLAAPLCAISILLVALTTGPIVYVLPIATAGLAVGIISYKFILKNKIEKLESSLAKAKKIRKQAYENRELAFEDIFNRLQNKNLDRKDYYHQLVNIHEKCNLLNDYMEPYKNKRKVLIKAKKIVSGLFDYLLAPVGAIGLPLLCSFVSVGAVAEIIMMAVSSATLLGCALTDDQLTAKIEDISDEIDDIKSDRTVNYVKRDIKLTEALEFLKQIDHKYNDVKLTMSLRKTKNVNNKVKVKAR